MTLELPIFASELPRKTLELLFFASELPRKTLELHFFASELPQKPLELPFFASELPQKTLELPFHTPEGVWGYPLLPLPLPEKQHVASLAFQKQQRMAPRPGKGPAEGFGYGWRS